MTFLVNLLACGSAIAVPVAFGLAITRGASARARYAVAVGAFAFAAVLPVLFTLAPPRTSVLPRSDLAPVVVPAQVGAEAVADVRPVVDWKIVWVAVAALLLARETGGHRVLAQRRRTWTRAPRAMRDALAWPDDVPLFVSAAPETIGLLRPAVVLPETWLSNLGHEAARCVARHELAHARWRDPLVNMVVRTVRAILWPSAPLWLLERVIRIEREAAADREAVAPETDVADYAAVLVLAAERGASAATAFAGAGLEERIRRLVHAPRVTPLRIAVALALGAAGLHIAVAVPIADSRRPPPLAIPSGASTEYQASADAMNVILAWTEHRNHESTKAVHAQLARIRDVAPLVDALHADDARLRESAAWIAGELGDPRLREPLGRLRASDPDRFVREAASWALRR